MVASAGHRFWPDDVALATDENLLRDRLLGHRQATDAHLSSLAIRHGGRLATFDRGVRDLVPEGRAAGEVLDLIDATPVG